MVYRPGDGGPGRETPESSKIPSHNEFEVRTAFTRVSWQSFAGVSRIPYSHRLRGHSSEDSRVAGKGSADLRGSRRARRTTHLDVGFGSKKILLLLH